MVANFGHPAMLCAFVAALLSERRSMSLAIPARERLLFLRVPLNASALLRRRQIQRYRGSATKGGHCAFYADLHKLLFKGSL